MSTGQARSGGKSRARILRVLRTISQRSWCARMFVLYGKGGREARNGRIRDADSQPTHSQAARRETQAQQGAGPDQLSAEARRVHARLYDNAEKAELGVAQGGEGAAHQRL